MAGQSEDRGAHGVAVALNLDEAASQLLELALYGDRGNEAKMTREILHVLREFAAGVLAGGTTACPICQKATPHHHTEDEVQAARLMALPEAEVDAELRRLGIDPDDAARQGKAAVEGALKAIRARNAGAPLPLDTPERHRYWALGWNDCAAAVERTVGHPVVDKVKPADGVLAVDEGKEKN